MAKRVSASKARDEFADIINRVAYGGETVLVHRRRKPVAAVIPIENLKLLEEIEERIDIREARKAVREKGRNYTLAEVKRRYGL
ncbi:MAG: type II toxin-antitoxin system prevent-host-death family antitoxin [Terriglobales bacterium]